MIPFLINFMIPSLGQLGDAKWLIRNITSNGCREDLPYQTVRSIPTALVPGRTPNTSLTVRFAINRSATNSVVMDKIMMAPIASVPQSRYKNNTILYTQKLTAPSDKGHNAQISESYPPHLFQQDTVITQHRMALCAKSIQRITPSKEKNCSHRSAGIEEDHDPAHS